MHMYIYKKSTHTHTHTQYLSNADERLEWQANALPTDDLCTENAIMIKRFNRYPLVVDPSGQATEFIMNEYRDRKITRTRWGQHPNQHVHTFSSCQGLYCIVHLGLCLWSLWINWRVWKLRVCIGLYVIHC